MIRTSEFDPCPGGIVKLYYFGPFTLGDLIERFTMNVQGAGGGPIDFTYGLYQSTSDTIGDPLCKGPIAIINATNTAVTTEIPIWYRITASGPRFLGISFNNVNGAGVYDLTFYVTVRPKK